MNREDASSKEDELQRELASLRLQVEKFQRLASIPQLNPASIFEFDLHGELIYLNPAAQQTLDELHFTDAHKFLPDDFAEISKDLQSGSSTQFYREKIFDNRIFDEKIVYSPEYRTFCLFAIEITQRKQVEEALRRSKLKIAETLDFFEAATKGTDVLIAVVDMGYHYIFFNQAYKEEIKRLSGVEIQLGVSMLDVFAHLPELQKVVMDEWVQVMRGQSTSKVLEFGDPNLYKRTYNVLHTPIRDHQGNISGAGEVALNISDQLYMQEALRESEARFRLVLKNIPVMVAALDKDLRFIWAYNQRTMIPVDVIGKTDMDIFPPETATWLVELKRQVLKTGKELSDARWVSVGEQRVFLDVFLEPICDKNGQISGVGSAIVDLTSVKQAEQSLSESEARYRSLFESMTEGFAIHELIFDSEGRPYDYRFLDINPAFERLTGLTREMVVGKTYREVLPMEGDRWVNYYGKVVTSGEPTQFEEFSASLNQYYEVYAYKVAPNQFATIFLNITKRQKIEDELRTNLAKYSVLFNSLPLGVTITDSDGHIVESNQEATRLLGLSQDELNRRFIRGEEWKIIRPDGSPMSTDEFASVRAMQEHRRIENVEMGVSKEDGDVSWISVTAAPLPLEDYGIVITYNDITRRIKAEEELYRAHDELEMTVQQRTQELQDANIELKAEIEERKKIESKLVVQSKALEAERHRFNDVLEILPVYTILLTPDYHVAFANRYFRERFGEDNGQRCYEYLFGLKQPCENCETFKVLKTNDRHRWEWVGPDQRNYDVFDFPFKDNDGSALILELGIDVTERKNAEEKLRLLNAYNRSLIEASPDALVTITPDGKIGDVNSVTEAITGYNREELIGKEFHSYFTDPEKARAGYRQVFDTGTVRDYELEIHHKDGHTTPVTYNASVYRDETGKVAGVFAAARDISQHKRSEEALRKSEQEYRSLVIASAQMVWKTNAQGEVVEDIPVWRDYTGQSWDECKGSGWVNAVHPADQERVAKVWAHAVENKTNYETECRIRNRFNEYGDFSVRAVPILDKDGNITSWIGTSTDITEKKNYENQLIQAEKHAVIGRMVGSVTHEINNPLQTIKNCLYLIQQDLQPDSPSAEPLDMALSETQRLSNIVGQLRQLYRPQATEMQSHQLLGIISEIQSLISHQIANSNINYKLAPGITDYPISCVREQLIEVFLNICMNAIEAMQPSGGTLLINIAYSADKAQVGVMISDTGPGIQPEILPHIFEPFITTKEYGLGLGLSICYGIVQKHGGQITVESQVGQGTCFTVWLPIIS